MANCWPPSKNHALDWRAWCEATAGWFREALNFLCEYVLANNYDVKFSIEPKPNEPRGDLYLPTVGSVLAFIATLDVGLTRP